MRFIFYLLPLFLLLGCGTTAVVDHNNNNDKRLNMIGALSHGITVTLGEGDIPSSQQLNTYVGSLANTPTPEETSLVLASISGTQQRIELEKQIGQLIIEKRQMETEQRARLATLQHSNDTMSERLKKLSNPFYSLWYGVSTIVKRSAYLLGGMLVVFLLLRVLSPYNPVAGAVFGVFEVVAASVLKFLRYILPRVFKFAGAVDGKDFDLVRSSRNKVVDALETLYILHKDKPIPLSTVFDVLSEKMTPSEKAEIKRALGALGYKSDK